MREPDNPDDDRRIRWEALFVGSLIIAAVLAWIIGFL